MKKRKNCGNKIFLRVSKLNKIFWRLKTLIFQPNFPLYIHIGFACLPYNYQLWPKAIRGEIKLRQAFFIKHSTDALFSMQNWIKLLLRTLYVFQPIRKPFTNLHAQGLRPRAATKWNRKTHEGRRSHKAQTQVL